MRVLADQEIASISGGADSGTDAPPTDEESLATWAASLFRSDKVIMANTAVLGIRG